MNLLIIGAPGAGKGTMSELILKNYHLVHVSTGDMLREAVRNSTPVGLKAQEYMNRGELVPEEIIHDIIADRFSHSDIDAGFLFDGYPRTRNQAEDLDSILKDMGKKIDCVINLNIDDEELIKRITGRRLCPACGEIYNVYSNPPKEEGKCDKCGAELIQRKDDNLDSLKVRLSEYHKNTQPVIEYYEAMDLVRHVEASGGIEEVYGRINSILEGLC
ncbi:MAG: adenylate kinase [Oscillospiraceae bacterium]|nr:adenylate kinase [Erysipelotrichaceae bacterium]MBQ6149259.1 adenylate kinase [Oscillospiraceae bacterium]MBQ6494183.1 adenylate kinase [Erysipelotrichaceae bacterium]